MLSKPPSFPEPAAPLNPAVVNRFWVAIASDFKQAVFEFEVYDTGIGIEQEELPLIFQDFKQLDNEFKIKYKGTGLGLTITRKLIELQGGTIDVDSRKGRGTTFTFTLTYELSKISIPSTKSPQSDPFAIPVLEQKILVVEDNEMNRKYLIGLLNKWQLRYDVALTENRLLSLFKKNATLLF